MSGGFPVPATYQNGSHFCSKVSTAACISCQSCIAVDGINISFLSRPLIGGGSPSRTDHDWGRRAATPGLGVLLLVLSPATFAAGSTQSGNVHRAGRFEQAATCSGLLSVNRFRVAAANQLSR
jgi:hypothetical protein